MAIRPPNAQFLWMGGNVPMHMIAPDLDNDGLDDIVVTNHHGKTLSIRLNGVPADN
jgi:hypothetical protein